MPFLATTFLRRAILAASLALLPASALASVIVQDDFNYPDGTLVPQGGWQAHSGAGAKPVQVSGGSIILQQSTGSGEDINLRWFVPEPVTQKTYASFHVTLPGTGTVAATEYFAHFRPAAPDTNGFVARVFVSPGSDAGHYILGIASGSATSSVVVNWPTELEKDVDYLVVTAYDPVTGSAQLWVNPTDESSASVTSAGVASTIGKAVESYAFRQASPAGATYTETIGDVIVGTEFADVASGSAVPVKAATWGAVKKIYR